MKFRPGDKFVGEVTKSKLWESKDVALRGLSHSNYQILTVGFDIPNHMKPYFSTFPWPIHKYGPPPKIGDKIELVFFHSPSSYMQSNHGKGTFRPTGIICNKEQEMAMSKDRVKFYIHPTYFQYNKLYSVLERAFGISANEARGYLNNYGITIICRPSQFARFMIYRNDAGIKNGFMDLKPELIEPQEKQDPLDLLAEAAKISRHDAANVARFMQITGQDILDRLSLNKRGQSKEIDVSENPHRR
jgi:hypothetical protein